MKGVPQGRYTREFHPMADRGKIGMQAESIFEWTTWMRPGGFSAQKIVDQGALEGTHFPLPRYRRSDSQQDGERADILLTTTGRRSGKGRTVPLGYLMDASSYVLTGSNGGQDEHPAWILNLRANPQATVQIRRTRIPVVAEQADSLRRSQLWAELIAQAPIYDGYRRQTAREIPMVVLGLSHPI